MPDVLRQELIVEAFAELRARSDSEGSSSSSDELPPPLPAKLRSGGSMTRLPAAGRETVPTRAANGSMLILDPNDPLYDPHDALQSRLREIGAPESKDRVWHLVKYPRCFVGSELVTALVQVLGCTREEVRIALLLMLYSS